MKCNINNNLYFGLTKQLFDKAIGELTSDNFADMVDNCKADIRPMLSSLNESELHETALFITSLDFLTNDIVQKHKKRNVLVLKDYLKKYTPLCLDDIETFVKPDYLRFAILRMVEINNKRKQEAN